MEWLRNLTPCVWEECQQQTDALELCVAQSSLTLFLPPRLKERPIEKVGEGISRRLIKREKEDLSYEPVCDPTYVHIVRCTLPLNILWFPSAV